MLKIGNKCLLVVATICMIVAVASFIMFFVQGSIIVVGDYPDKDSNETIICTKNDYLYPFITDANIHDGDITMKIIFEASGLSSFSFVYRARYADNVTAKVGSARMHADMNLSFSSVLGPDALGARYSVDGDVVQMSLSGDGAAINELSKKYLLVNDSPKTRQDYYDNYIDQGFECE